MLSRNLGSSSGSNSVKDVRVRSAHAGRCLFSRLNFGLALTALFFLSALMPLSAATFIRSDANGDGVVDLADPLRIPPPL